MAAESEMEWGATTSASFEHTIVNHLLRMIAVSFAFFFYFKLEVMFLDTITPGFTDRIDSQRVGPHLLFPAVVAMIVAVWRPDRGAALWNSVAFGLIFLLEFSMWITAAVYFILFEFRFYTEAGMWFLLCKSGAVAVACATVSLCFFFASSWTRWAMLLYAVIILAAETINVQPWAPVYVLTPPPVQTLFSGDFMRASSKFMHVPNVWMILLYFVALYWVFRRRPGGGSAVPDPSLG